MGTVKKKMAASKALKGLTEANKGRDLAPVEKKFRITSMMLAAMKTPDKTVTIAPYVPVPGVVPAGKRKAALALDATPYDYVNSVYGGTASFQGYPYLANLAQLPEFRAISDTIATELTRKFIKITSKGDTDKTEKIKKVQDCFDRLDVRGKFRESSLYDGLYGRGQIYLEFKGKADALASEDENELAAPLFLSNKKIAKGSLTGLRTIEPVWTYPSAYNATNPLARDYYQPGAWYVMNKTVHTSRLLTFVSRPVPDLLKASYNFGGLSMSQLAEPYVNNWLRTRDSVSDMIHSYSVAGLSTDLSTLLGDGESATDLANRAALFTQTRDNRGLMILNKDSEEFFQFNTPLSGLSDLQEQAQGQLCFVSHLPPIKLFGVSPGGLSGSGEDIMVAFRDWIGSQREILFTDNLNQIMGLVQLSELGELDPDIVWEFEPLEEMSDAEIAEINDKKSKTDVALIGAGVLAPEEVRTRLAADEHSGYNGLDVEDVPEIEEPEKDTLQPGKKEKPAQDEGVFILAELVNGQWVAQDSAHWITTEEGEHILLNGNNEVIGGAGGKLNGKKFDNVQSKGKNVERGPEDNPDKGKEPKPTGRKYEPQKTAKEAAKVAVDSGLLEWADFGKCSAEVANEMLAGLSSHLEEFPELSGHIKFFGSTQTVNNYLHEKRVADYRSRLVKANPNASLEDIDRWAKHGVKKRKTINHAYAIAYGSRGEATGAGIGFTEKHGLPKNSAALGDSLRAGVASGFHPPGLDSIKGIVDHELAHSLDEMVGARKSHKMIDLWVGENRGADVSEDPKMRRGNKIADGLSKYATNNISEFIAEGWAEYRNSSNPREIAAKIGKIMEEEYAKFKASRS